MSSLQHQRAMFVFYAVAWAQTGGLFTLMFALIPFILLVYSIHVATYWRPELQLSINVHHYIERHGLLIIILLGEGIISLVAADVAVDVDQYVIAFGCFFTISFLYFLYFEFQ